MSEYPKYEFAAIVHIAEEVGEGMKEALVATENEETGRVLFPISVDNHLMEVGHPLKTASSTVTQEP